MSDLMSGVDKMMQLITGTKDPVAIAAAAQVQRGMVQILDENRKLHDEVVQLKRTAEKKEQLDFHDNAYWYKDGKGPFCSRCFDVDGKVVRMADISAMELTSTYVYKCNNCKAEIHTRIELPDEYKTI
jgi:hypothetical protein